MLPAQPAVRHSIVALVQTELAVWQPTIRWWAEHRVSQQVCSQERCQFGLLGIILAHLDHHLQRQESNVQRVNTRGEPTQPLLSGPLRPPASLLFQATCTCLSVQGLSALKPCSHLFLWRPAPCHDWFPCLFEHRRCCAFQRPRYAHFMLSSSGG